MAKNQRRELDRACAYCENASVLQDKDYMLCAKYGIVSADHTCRRFSYDPLKRIPVPRRSIDTNIELPELP